MKASELMEQIIWVGGLPRGGTTFAAKSLSLHPRFVIAIDDHVYECWGLYYYRNRSGLIREIRTRSLTPEEAKQMLACHLFAENCLIGAAPSDKTKGFSPVAQSQAPFPGSVRSKLDDGLERYSIPLAQFSGQWRLCLKSPEISFALPQLACLFPKTSFVLVYRPILEVAGSMHRLGHTVKQFPVYHKRWLEEKNEAGILIPPPGIPGEWNTLWQTASDFQRCVIYAASYMRGLLQGAGAIDPGRYFVYNHHDLQKFPRRVFGQMAQFLAVEVSGFQTAEKLLKTDLPSIPPPLLAQYAEVETTLALKQITHQMDSLCESMDGLNQDKT